MKQSPISRTDMIVLMGGITALTAVSIDIVLPSTGLVARHFGEEEQRGALLVGVYFIAYAVGQLFWGLFSDAFGRRRALILSLSGFAIASLVCALAPSFTVLIAARFAQGLMGAAPVIARAMVRDVTHGEEAARVMTVLGAILSISTMFAPVIGSAMLILFDWRAVFVALMLLSLAFLAYCLFILEETGKRRPERFSLGFLLRSGGFLLTNRQFLIPMAAGSFTFGGYASVGAVGAIIAEARYGVSPEAFGALFAVAALVNTGGALLAGQLLKRLSLRQVGNVAMTLLATAAALHFVLSTITPVLQLFWGSVCLYVFAFGIILPTAFASAMEPAGEMPGFAASVMGSIQMVAGAGGAMLASSLFDGTHSAINVCMALFGTLAALTVMMDRVFGKKAA